MSQRVKEFHNIMPIANIPSVLVHAGGAGIAALSAQGFLGDVTINAHLFFM